MKVYEAQNLLLWSGRLGTLAIALVFIVMLYRWRVFFRIPYIFLFFAYLVSLILNIFVIWLVEYTAVPENYYKIKPVLDRLEIHNTFFVDPIFFLKNCLFFGGFVWYKYIKKRAFFILLAGLVLFNVINTIWGESYKKYQVLGTIVDNAFLTILAGVILRMLFNGNLNKSLWKIPEFWFSLSFVIMGLVGGLLDVLSNSMFSQTEILFYQLHSLKNGFSTLAYLFFAYGAYLVVLRREVRGHDVI